MLTKIQPSNIIHLNGIQPSIIIYGYGSIPINTIFSGMNIHLPAILMFTRGTRFWHTAIWLPIWMFPKMGLPPNHPSYRRIFPYKPAIYPSIPAQNISATRSGEERLRRPRSLSRVAWINAEWVVGSIASSKRPMCWWIIIHQRESSLFTNN
jgi:hypothetical protein